MQARLLREAQAASALNHPGIVTVHDVGSWHGQIFMVMELVDGEPLSELARRGMPPAEALRLVADAAEALAAAHEREILHRDIKSDNLMRTRDGRIKVLDFGLAKLRAQPEAARRRRRRRRAAAACTASPDLAAVAETLDSTSRSGRAVVVRRPTPRRCASCTAPSRASPFPPLSSPSSSESLTMAGALVGTPVYMAPEQTDGTPGDPQSEVWSLGVVLYELLVGKRPFERASIPEVLQAIRTQHDRAAVAGGAGARDSAAARRGGAQGAGARSRGSATPTCTRSRRRSRRRAGGSAASHTGARGGAARRRAARARRRRRRARAGVRGRRLGVLRARAAPPPPPKPEPPSVTVTSTRRITFDTGCEEYPSFTPDGRTVVFDGVIENDYELLRARRRLGHHRAADARAGLGLRRRRLARRQVDRVRAHLRLRARGARPADRGRSRRQAGAARAELRRASRRGRATAPCSSARATRSCAGRSIRAARASETHRAAARRARSIATSRSSPTATWWRCGSRSTRPTWSSSARSARGRGGARRRDAAARLDRPARGAVAGGLLLRAPSRQRQRAGAAALRRRGRARAGRRHAGERPQHLARRQAAGLLDLPRVGRDRAAASGQAARAADAGGRVARHLAGARRRSARAVRERPRRRRAGVAARRQVARGAAARRRRRRRIRACRPTASGWRTAAAPSRASTWCRWPAARRRA